MLEKYIYIPAYNFAKNKKNYVVAYAYFFVVVVLRVPF